MPSDTRQASANMKHEIYKIIQVNVDKTFSLDQAGKALDYQKDVHPGLKQR